MKFLFLCYSKIVKLRRFCRTITDVLVMNCSVERASETALRVLPTAFCSSSAFQASEIAIDGRCVAAAAEIGHEVMGLSVKTMMPPSDADVARRPAADMTFLSSIRQSCSF